MAPQERYARGRLVVKLPRQRVGALIGISQ
jgi:hypothetical protein